MVEFRWVRRFPCPSRLALRLTHAPSPVETGTSSGVKQLGRGAGHPPRSSANVENGLGLYLILPSLHGHVMWRPLPFLLHTNLSLKESWSCSYLEPRTSHCEHHVRIRLVKLNKCDVTPGSSTALQTAQHNLYTKYSSYGSFLAITH